jgi:hypothetical protein
MIESFFPADQGHTRTGYISRYLLAQQSFSIDPEPVRLLNLLERFGPHGVSLETGKGLQRLRR